MFVMARRTDISKLEPQAARKAIATHFRTVASRSGINLAQFQAQLAAEDMVKLIAGFANDPLLPAPFRKECAIDVVTIAYGKIQPWYHEGEHIDPSAQSAAANGSTLGQEIDQARLTAELYQQLDELVRRKVPPEHWPESVRTLAGEAIAYYQIEGEPMSIDTTLTSG